MTFGLQVDEPGQLRDPRPRRRKGITFIDTADAYPLGGDLTTVGRTEEILGRWMSGQRDQYVVATKCFAPTGPKPWDTGNSRRHIMDSIDASLRRLQTDFIDLYQLHFDDRGVPLEESLGALDDLVRVGKVRYIGCSNYLAYRLAQALGKSETLGLARFDCVQPRYNLLFREFERELFPLCLDEGVGVIPYNPIAGGMLSGKHDRSKPPEEGTRFTLGNAAPHVPGPLLARQRVRHGRRAREGRRQRGHPAADARGRVDARDTRRSRRRSSARAGPSSSTRRAPRVDVTLEPDLLATLNELTAPYRRGDAPR